MRKVARHMGFSHGAIIRWLKIAPQDGRMSIPTQSSRPHTHPKALSHRIVDQIVEQRKKYNRCAEVIHQELLRKGVRVSLSSVKRTLKRCRLLRERSPWKRWHASPPRPTAEKAGDLVQIDTIHLMRRSGERFYTYTLIDIYSRWAFAKVVARISTQPACNLFGKPNRPLPFPSAACNPIMGQSSPCGLQSIFRVLE